jgi:hypothetical protein
MRQLKISWHISRALGRRMEEICQMKEERKWL